MISALSIFIDIIDYVNNLNLNFILVGIFEKKSWKLNNNFIRSKRKI